jgi:hypothetical protein
VVGDFERKHSLAVDGLERNSGIFRAKPLGNAGH